MKQKKSQKYFEIINRLELEVLHNPLLVWQMEKVGEVNSFSIMMYQTTTEVSKRALIIAQVWYNGAGVNCYLPDGESTWEGSRIKISKL